METEMKVEVRIVPDEIVGMVSRFLQAQPALVHSQLPPNVVDDFIQGYVQGNN